MGCENPLAAASAIHKVALTNLAKVWQTYAAAQTAEIEKLMGKPTPQHPATTRLTVTGSTFHLLTRLPCAGALCHTSPTAADPPQRVNTRINPALHHLCCDECFFGEARAVMLHHLWDLPRVFPTFNLNHRFWARDTPEILTYVHGLNRGLPIREVASYAVLPEAVLQQAWVIQRLPSGGISMLVWAVYLAGYPGQLESYLAELLQGTPVSLRPQPRVEVEIPQPGLWAFGTRLPTWSPPPYKWNGPGQLALAPAQRPLRCEGEACRSDLMANLARPPRHPTGRQSRNPHFVPELNMVVCNRCQAHYRDARTYYALATEIHRAVPSDIPRPIQQALSLMGPDRTRGQVIGRSRPALFRGLPSRSPGAVVIWVAYLRLHGKNLDTILNLL